MHTRSDSTELADSVPILESECLLSVSVDSLFIDAVIVCRGYFTCLYIFKDWDNEYAISTFKK